MVIKNINKRVKYLDKTVACIGDFDGVHKGHQALILKTVLLAKKNNVKAAVICFDPLPFDLINKNNKHILSTIDKYNHFKSFGIDYVYVLKFNEELMKLNPLSFINDYLNKMNIIHLVCGFDFYFGYKCKGNVDTLKKYGDFNVTVIKSQNYKNEKISSTRIKNELNKGNFSLVKKLLNYEYYLELIITKTIKMDGYWLLNCKRKDHKVLLPNITNKKDVYLKNNSIYIKSNKRINVGKIILFKPNDYE